MELERRTTAPAHATGAVEFVPLDAVADDLTFRLRDEGDVASLAASMGRLGQLVPIELRPLAGAAEGGPRFQVVAGFRRLAALRLLARDRVLARVHARLDDEDAWALALGLAILTEPLLASELAEVRERLGSAGIAPWADELLEDALAHAPIDPKLRERFQAWLARSAGEGAEAPEAEEPDDDGEVAVELDGGVEDGASVEDWGGIEIGARPGGGEAAADAPLEVTPDELAGDLAQRMYGVNQDLAVAFEAWAELPPEGGVADGARGEDGGGIESGARPGGGEAAADAPLEVTPDELAGDLAQRMYGVNQDLAVAFEAWAELPPEGRRAIVEQARYVAELLRLLDEGEEGT